MNQRIKSNCFTPYCRNLTTNKYCDSCYDLNQVEREKYKQTQEFKVRDQARAREYKRIYSNKLDRLGLNKHFYSSKPWRNLRIWFLNNHPLCNICQLPASQVDHVIPIALGGQALDELNLQSLCASCHSAKTRSENSKG